MSIEIVGKGFSVDFGLDQMGQVKLSSYEKNIEESIYIILSTKPGERVYNNKFGCRVHELMFEPNSIRTQNLAKHYVQKSIEEFEARIEVLTIEVSSNMENSINIDIQYKIRESNMVNNYVYPFYLVPQIGN